MTSCWTISLRELTIQPKQARVAGTCADHNVFYMDSLCLLSDNRKERCNEQKKRRKPDYTTQGSVVGWHYYRHTRFSRELSSTCHSVGFPCHRDVTSVDCHLVVVSFTLSCAHRMNPCCKRTRTYHLLHLRPESLVQQSVSKGIDGRVKYYYRVRDRSR